MEDGTPVPETLFRELGDHLPDFIWLREVETGTVLYINGGWERFTGIRVPIGASYREFFKPTHPGDRERAERAGQHHPAGGYDETLRFVHADGTTRWVHIRTFPVLNPEGRVYRVLGIGQDVTEQRQREDALRQMQQAIATSLNAVAMADSRGRITYANPAFLRLWGFDSQDEVLGKQPTDLGERQRTLEVLRGVQEQGAWQGELEAIRRDGSRFPMLLSASVVRDDQGSVTGMMASFLDLTEAKRLETELLQAAKMESVGRLAGGVAHDFNNLLTVIKGNASLALFETDADGPQRPFLELVNKAADSAAALTQQLLAFSRKQIISPKVIDLNEAIGGVRTMLGRLLGEHIQLETFMTADLGLVRFDPGQAEQILLNLAVNARDAMPEGGTLTIESGNVFLDDEYARRHPGVHRGHYVRLAVSDTGAGMTAEVRQHLFEPFFTTKLLGKGTGLGLPMVYGAVKQNGGLIEVYSEPAHGTTFKIYLPVVTGVVEQIIPAPAVPPARGSEAIVLVEDDESVRVVAALLLRRQGYTIHSFGDGVHALEALEGFEGPVHLLVTDVVMPRMNGQVLASRLGAQYPNLRVLFTSGYTANVIVHHGVLKEGVEFLAKPYSTDDLARRVRETLDKPA